MILVQTPNGKTVGVDLWKFINQGFQDLIADDQGMFINDPFFETTSREPKDILEEIPDIEELKIEEIDIEEINL